MTFAQGYKLVEWFKKHEDEIRTNKLDAEAVARMASAELGFYLHGHNLRARVGSGQGCVYPYDWSYSSRSCEREKIDIVAEQLGVLVRELGVPATADFQKLMQKKEVLS